MRIVLSCTDVVGTRMAGPGIRYWELAHALAERHDVTLVGPGMDVASDTVRLVRQGDEAVGDLLQDAQALMTQTLTPGVLAQARRRGTRILLDAYVPSPIEALQHESSDAMPARRAHSATILASVRLGLLAADAVLCASERQRDLWIGALMALGRLTPAAYDADPALGSLIAVVPFGLASTPPKPTGAGPRELFGLPPDAVIALWGGGVWEWFDPVTVIDAVALARRTVPQLQLAFMGIRHPTNAGHDSAAARALARIDELGLAGNGVLVADGWLPYDQRAAWLLDADIGVSANLDIVENRFAFRTRVLDYLWAGLPCVLTGGDSMADLAGAAGFGVAIAPGDIEGWAATLTELAVKPGRRETLARAAKHTSRRFTWPAIASELERVIIAVVQSPPRPFRPSHVTTSARWAASGAAAMLIRQGPAKTLERLRGAL